MDSTSSIFLHNFPHDVTRDGIEALCRCAGTVTATDLRDGFAIVTFIGDAAADCAVRKLHGFEAFGRMLTCKLSETALRNRDRRRRDGERASRPRLSAPRKRSVDGFQDVPNRQHELRNGGRAVRPKLNVNSVSA